MIDAFRSLAVFDAVARAGSFSAAAKELRLSTSVVSHHVSKLEQRLGVSLLYRSTRSLSLTPEGTRIKEAVSRMVEAGNEAIDLLNDDTDQPVGTLRISVPAFGGSEGLLSKVWDFAVAYPTVALSVTSSDSARDLITDGIDLAIRLGNLGDSSLKSRRVGTFRRVLVASPDYLNGRPPIRSVDDLRASDFVAFSMIASEIDLSKNGEVLRFVPDHVRVEVDTVVAAISAVRLGLGIQRVPLSEVRADLAEGTLVEVLPDHRPPDLGIYVVWPDVKPEKRLTRLFIDFLTTK